MALARTISATPQQRRADEMAALESIYSPECFFYDPHDPADAAPDTRYRGELRLSIGAGPAGVTVRAANVEPRLTRFLPPLIVSFVLPPDYPERAPPQVQLTCQWLSPSKLEQLASAAQALWTPNSEILFSVCTAMEDGASGAIVDGILDLTQRTAWSKRVTCRAHAEPQWTRPRTRPPRRACTS